ncbi:hypothetical protein HMPREF0219_1129 [Clostridioides difficile NAP07]|nr:hypothetical protein HMPREF0219_1129 [Clostridioides difficile NAP07]
MEIKISKDKSDRLTKKKTDGSMDILYKIILLVIIFLVWHFAAKDIGSSLRTVVARSSIILLGAFNAVN